MNAIVGMGLGLALVGALVAWWGWRLYQAQGARFAAVQGWTKTTARVLESAIIDREASAEGYQSTVSDPQLHYAYEVDGKTFEGRRIALNPPEPFVDLKDAQQWLVAHAPGSTIDLWYDPADMSDSTPSLDRPNRLQAAMMIGLGVALLPLALFMLAKA